MPRFFIDENALSGNIITVTGGDAVHIGRSLRMRIGDEITFCREGKEFICTIENITSDKVFCRVNKTLSSQCEPTLNLTVFQAFPKGDKAELIIQKCTELGVSEIVFFISKRCVSRPEGKSAENKISRFAKIAEEAAKQSGRGKIPIIRGILTFEEAVNELRKKQLPLFCYENGGKSFSEISFDGITECGVMIGSEGGFDSDEAGRVIQQGITPLWLGKRILRCETCPIAVTAVIMNLTRNF